ncbi:MAG: hypothetical protein ACI85F_002019, partial [Bacteroidia bacterium]
GAAGSTGAAGLDGTNGLDGSTGAMGPTGANGVDGTNGLDGTTGAMGPTGAAGLDGTNGIDGAAGAQGPTGNDGLAGATGAQGPTGNDGLAGATGAQGPTGNDGLAGTIGAQGPTGNDGLAGATGAQGPTGNDGLAGATGAQGPTGNDGLAGSTGAQGPTGNDGLAGATGAQGPTGNDGLAGATGAQGPTGNDGLAGATGAQGPTGNDGLAGATGAQGPTGNDGLAGATGAQGPTGNDGLAGTTGAQGPTGNDGLAGATGAQGPTGNDGLAGTTGAQGPTGNDGLAGATGAQGPTGNDGLAGAIGPTGPSGNNGFNGSNGLNGADGAPGATGATGAMGPTGNDGNDGAIGPTGAVGNDGANGPSGADGATGAPGPVGCTTANTVIKSNGTTAVCSQIFDNGTNVGIGTVAPDMKMVISDPAASFVKATSTASWAGVIADKANATDNNYFILRTGNSDRWVMGSLGNDDFHLYDWQNGTSAIYAQQATGNVGMGTTAPADRLDVNGITRLGTGTYASAVKYDGYFEGLAVSDGNRLYSTPSASAQTIGWGYVGTSTNYWWYMYSNNFIDPSRREIKENITPINDDLYEVVLKDIDRIQPSFYRYIGETEKVEEGNESKFRPNMHLGVILDESPDYIQDNAFSGVDIYGIATLSLAGVKHNRSRLNSAEKTAMELVDSRDFGVVELSQTEVSVSFDQEFTSLSIETPVVMITPMGPNVVVYVSEVTKSGFNLIVESGLGEKISWVGLTKIENVSVSKGDEAKIPNAIMKGLKVSQSEKTIIAEFEEKKRNDQLNSRSDQNSSNKAPSHSSTETGAK